MSISNIQSIKVILQYTLYEALKNRIIWIAVILAFIGIAGASFFGDFAVIETQRTEVSVVASFYRFCAVFTMMILVISTMVREFNDKCLELYLSLPITRLTYFIGKLCGFFISGVVVAIIYLVAISLYVDTPIPLIAWFISLICELTIITSISFFCVMTFNQQVPASVITAFFFYLLCRLTDTIVLISQSDIIIHTFGFAYLKSAINILLVILPSLGRFTQSQWLIYGEVQLTDIMPLIITQTVIYTALLSGAALFDFTRKNI